MQITSPIDNLSEFEALANSGANELFLGMCLDGMFISGRRQTYIGETFHRKSDVIELLDKAHRSGVKAFLALNKYSYTQKELDAIRNNLDFLKVPDALIVTNLSLSIELGKKGFNIFRGSELYCMNPESAKFLPYVKRIIFDRQVFPDDLKELTKLGFETEMFIMNERCMNINCFCQFYDFSKEWNHLCYHNCRAEPSFDDARGIELAKQVEQHVAMPISCGLCALKPFHEAGVAAVKIVGRGKSTDKKVRSVKLVKAALDKVNLPKQEFFNQCKKLFAEEFGHPCEEKYCYHPALK